MSRIVLGMTAELLIWPHPRLHVNIVILCWVYKPQERGDNSIVSEKTYRKSKLWNKCWESIM